jgi:hypothetical protein
MSQQSCPSPRQTATLRDGMEAEKYETDEFDGLRVFAAAAVKPG